MRHIVDRLLRNPNPRWTLLALLGLLFSLPALAQTTGGVQGTVTDPSGAVLAGAQLTLTNTATNVSVTATSASSGSYFFSSLQPGNYTLRCLHPGFKEGTISSITITAQTTVTVDVHLVLGADTQTVNVSAFGANDIDLTTAQVSTTVGEEKILNLPNTSRNVLNFAQLAPGVDFGSQAEGGSQVMNITDQSASMNGSDEQHNNFYLDGIDNTGGFRNYAMQFPNPDAIQEVQTLSSNAGAELGRQAGGVVNVITRSGSNAFHGDAFYFAYPRSWSANSWGNDHYGVAKPPQNQEQWGGVVGGPIFRDKTFFFFSYLKYSNNTVSTLDTYRGITPAMLNGDFSALLRDPVRPLQLYNPDTGVALPNNQIPASLIDPVSRKLFALIPQVPVWGDYYHWTFDEPIGNQEIFGKLDHHWSDSHVTTFSVLRVWGQGVYPATQAYASGCCSLNRVPDFPGEEDTNGQWTTSLRHTWIVKPTVTVEAYVGLNRQSADRGTEAHSVDLADLGAINFPISQAGARKYMPGFSASGPDAAQAQNGWLSLYIQTDYHMGGKLTWIKDSHAVTVGADFERDQARQYNDEDGLSFSFDGQYSGNGAAEQNQTGTSYADMLMGRSSGFGQSGIDDEKLHDWSNFFYGADVWKVNPRLTLTPALRYEYYLPYKAANNHATGYIAGHKSTFFPTAPVGLAFPEDPGVPSGLYPTDWGQVSPRIGVAYDLRGDGRWALRAGFGRYFSHLSGQYFMQNSESTPWEPSASCGEESRVFNPWLTCQGPVYPTPPTPFTVPNGGSYNWPSVINNVVGYSQDWKTPYSLQWNVALEHQPVRGITLTGMYVGNRMRDNTQGYPLNWSRYVDVDGQAPSLTNIVARRPQQDYGSILIYQPSGMASYQAFQGVANIRHSGVDATITYVEQRDWDTVAGGELNEDSTGQNPQTANPLCLYCERAELLAHRRFRVYAVWDLPILRARPSAGLWKLLGGWQVAGNFEADSGNPSDVQLGTDWNYDGISGDRPDRAGSIHYVKQNLHPATQNGYLEQYIDVGTPVGMIDGLPAQRGPFAAPPNHAVFGTLQRNAVWGPGSWIFNAAMSKNFYITEGRYFQFRADTVNILNHPLLSGPDLSYQDATFGQIQGKFNAGPRLVQLGGKFYF